MAPRPLVVSPERDTVPVVVTKEQPAAEPAPPMPVQVTCAPSVPMPAASGMVTVNLATMRKDVKTMLAQGESLQRAMPLTALALASFERAAHDGIDAADCSQYPVWWLQHGSKR